jgi:hypothetical protein
MILKYLQIVFLKLKLFHFLKFLHQYLLGMKLHNQMLKEFLSASIKIPASIGWAGLAGKVRAAQATASAKTSLST